MPTPAIKEVITALRAFEGNAKAALYLNYSTKSDGKKKTVTRNLINDLIALNNSSPIDEPLHKILFEQLNAWINNPDLNLAAVKTESVSSLDAELYNALLVVVAKKPFNDIDPLSQYAIDPKWQVLTSTGHQFDLRFLKNIAVVHQGEWDVRQHKRASKDIRYNPITNNPFPDKDLERINQEIIIRESQLRAEEEQEQGETKEGKGERRSSVVVPAVQAGAEQLAVQRLVMLGVLSSTDLAECKRDGFYARIERCAPYLKNHSEHRSPAMTLQQVLDLTLEQAERLHDNYTCVASGVEVATARDLAPEEAAIIAQERTPEPVLRNYSFQDPSVEPHDDADAYELMYGELARSTDYETVLQAVAENNNYFKNLLCWGRNPRLFDLLFPKNKPGKRSHSLLEIAKRNSASAISILKFTLRDWLLFREDRDNNHARLLQISLSHRDAAEYILNSKSLCAELVLTPDVFATIAKSRPETAALILNSPLFRAKLLPLDASLAENLARLTEIIRHHYSSPEMSGLVTNAAAAHRKARTIRAMRADSRGVDRYRSLFVGHAASQFSTRTLLVISLVLGLLLGGGFFFGLRQLVDLNQIIAAFGGNELFYSIGTPLACLFPLLLVFILRNKNFRTPMLLGVLFGTGAAVLYSYALPLAAAPIALAMVASFLVGPILLKLFTDFMRDTHLAKFLVTHPQSRYLIALFIAIASGYGFAKLGSALESLTLESVPDLNTATASHLFLLLSIVILTMWATYRLFVPGNSRVLARWMTTADREEANLGLETHRPAVELEISHGPAALPVPAARSVSARRVAGDPALGGVNDGSDDHEEKRRPEPTSTGSFYAREEGILAPTSLTP